MIYLFITILTKERRVKDIYSRRFFNIKRGEKIGHIFADSISELLEFGRKIDFGPRHIHCGKTELSHFDVWGEKLKMIKRFSSKRIKTIDRKTFHSITGQLRERNLRADKQA